jgi:uncharacterized protein (TIGR02145 family)
MKSKDQTKYPVYVFFVILSLLCDGCKETIETLNREKLISTIWLAVGDCNGEYGESYTLVFEANGRCTYSNNGVVSWSGSWSLDESESILVMNQIEYKIRTLSSTELVISAKSSDLLVSLCQITYKAASFNEATTIGVSDLTKTSVRLHGSVRTSNPANTLTFEYGTSTAYGQTVTVPTNLVPGVTTTQVTASLSGFTPGTIYHYKLKNINSSGTFYGQDMTFRTFNEETVSDIDGNNYNTITIGTQVWMGQNLKVTRFNDGNLIPLVTDNNEWGALTSPGYCWSNNDSVAYGNTYGALYNWFAVNSGKLSPAGWHVATDQDWIVLENYLGTNAGGKLREAGTDHWIAFQRGATNESGFTALPGSWRYDNGTFPTFAGDSFKCWSSTVDNEVCAWYYSIVSSWQTYSVNFIDLSRTISLKKSGYSIRCLKN